MEQLVDFENSNSPHLVCQLHKTLYGSKQAPRAQFEKLRDVLVSLGFMSSKSDYSLFIRHSANCTMFVLVYVDDILVTRSSKVEIQVLVQQLNTRFALKDLGEDDHFLGIQGKHIADGLHLSQTKYVTNLLCKTKMQQAKKMPTPMFRGEKLSNIGSDPVGNPQLY